MIVINETLLDEFRAKPRCEWCGRDTPGGCDPHHIFGRGVGGGTRLDIRENLIGLCRGFAKEGWVSCHDEVHAGNITRSDLLAKVAAREGIMQHTIERRIRKLQRTTGGAGKRRPRGKGMS